MLIDLYGLLSQVGEVKKLDTPLVMNKFESKLGNFDIDKVSEFSIELKSVGNKVISLNSVLDVTLLAPCDRCLVTVPKQIRVESFRELNYGEVSPDADETLADMSFIEGTTLDTERYAYCEILENFPMKVLCTPDCKGICNVCGMNLNLSECSCDRHVVDPRMAQFSDIFKMFTDET